MNSGYLLSLETGQSKNLNLCLKVQKEKSWKCETEINFELREKHGENACVACIIRRRTTGASVRDGAVHQTRRGKLEKYA